MKLSKAAKISNFLRHNSQNYQFKTHPPAKSKINFLKESESLSAVPLSSKILKLSLNNVISWDQ